MTAEYVEAIYLPTSLVDAPYVQKFLQDTGLKANLYKASGNKPAIEYQALLESELEQFHKFVGAL
ncbi:hypothetical protein LMG23994_02010 [Cupriavidus pinatubonensis]|uniref:Uncharacterized protein n=2 Tax=Cupriavidus pinatubonensis TaxID=248026 RepID=A0ABN7YBN0_9BURK|nr:hypothetical protein LMG23994_02010 [Cupriavidus pinatubonensis]